MVLELMSSYDSGRFDIYSFRRYVGFSACHSLFTLDLNVSEAAETLNFEHFLVLLSLLIINNILIVHMGKTPVLERLPLVPSYR
jgi:hypothetical protein